MPIPPEPSMPSTAASLLPVPAEEPDRWEPQYCPEASMDIPPVEASPCSRARAAAAAALPPGVALPARSLHNIPAKTCTHASPCL
eukprot:355136-Chlamydomonas_euryale.AAC.12